MNNFSKFGFILATLGSSIGLGHIWRFPYIVGTNGGGAFVLLYLLLALFLGIAMLVGEMVIGNRGRANAFKSYENLAPSKHKRWRYAGLTLIGGPIILSFYAVVLGWVFYYLVMVSFDLPTNMQDSKFIFDMLYTKGFIPQTLGLLFVMGVTGFVISRGVKKGIELLNFILTPLLFIIFFGLLLYAMSMEHFSDALKFMLSIDIENIKKALSINVFIDSLGQVFFSLSLGVGIVITYSASSEQHQNLLKSSLYIVLSGIAIAIMAGLMIFTFIYQYGGDVDEGAGLIFVALPVMLGKLGILGNIICVSFLIAFSFAGITSTISLLEPSVMYVCENYKVSRTKATWYISVAVVALGIVIICSLCTSLSAYLTFAGKTLMDIVEFLSANILMTLGGLLAVIFVGWIIPKNDLRTYTKHFFNAFAFEIWYMIMRYIAPIITILVLVGVCVKFYTGKSSFDVDFIIDVLGI